MTTHLTDLTLTEALDALCRKDFSSVELTWAYLHQIERIDPQVKAYITVTADQALDQARAADAPVPRAAMRPGSVCHWRSKM